MSSAPLSLTIILHMAVDEAQGAAPSDLSCFGGKAIAFVALEAVTSVIGVDVDRRLLRIYGLTDFWQIFGKTVF